MWDNNPLLVIVSALMGLVMVVNVIVWMGYGLAAVVTGTRPVETPLAAFEIARNDQISFSGLAWVTTAGIVALFAAPVVWLVCRRRRRCAQADPTDALARNMASGKDLAGHGRKAVAEANRRLSPGVNYPSRSEPGMLIGQMVVDGTPLYLSDEETGLMVAGTRSGKTQSLVTRLICEAPGSVLATSSKADIVDLTLGVREEVGPTWIFDPQNIFSSDPVGWWWNPLRGITTPAAAKGLASYFADGVRPAGSKRDAYFDPESERVFGAYILAASLAGGDMGHVFDWLLSPTATQLPAEILRVHGLSLAARSAEQTANLTSRQCDGIYGMARRYLDLLETPEVGNTILPPQRVKLGVADGQVIRQDAERLHSNPEFRLDEFVESDSQTLYLLTRKGPDSASGLTTALAGQLLQAAIRRAQRSPGRRLPVPLRPVLDEVANVVRLADLPQWYSDFGSQGITPFAFLQSWSQGEDVWDKRSLQAMSSAANVRIFGGSSDDSDYLSDLSQLIGDHYVATTSRTSSREGHSQSESWSRERLVGVNDLTALGKNHQLVHFNGAEPVFCRKVFWSQTSYAGKVRDSLDRARVRLGGDVVGRGFSDSSVQELP
ncbi:TraM recognition domain-containing protein [Corynebacterium bovis]|uniref:type IV secretory system conjugative DNA transfer family protein n=1 Tax=Corynebacterium bovis TaxID=36808 RepID=UPI003138F7BB